MRYNIFGSRSSIDCDIFVVVDKLPESKEECKKLCKKFEDDIGIESFYTPEHDGPRELNVNIGTIENGTVTSVYKGTSDEVNNSLFMTYNLHKQLDAKLVTTFVKRDIPLKFMRVARIVLSFLSRTEHRKEVKRALKGDFKDKLDVLESIDFREIKDLGTKNVSQVDFEKTVAFQFGQAQSLVYGHVDVYSKEQIARFCPPLASMLFRHPRYEFHMAILESYKKSFIRDARKLIIPHMTTFKEYKI